MNEPTTSQPQDPRLRKTAVAILGLLAVTAAYAVVIALANWGEIGV